MGAVTEAKRSGEHGIEERRLGVVLAGLDAGCRPPEMFLQVRA